MKRLVTTSILLLTFLSPVFAQEIAEELPITTISWETESHDFGLINEGDVVSHTFYFTNTGNEPAKIENVKPSCGCTTPDWTKEEIAPGTKGFVTLSFDSKGKAGFQKKTVVVTMNTEPKTKLLNFMTEVKSVVNEIPVNETIVPGSGLEDIRIEDPLFEEDPERESPMQKNESSPKPTKAVSNMRFDHDEIDFGKFNTGKKVSHSFSFVNSGNASVKIADVYKSCDCITVIYPENSIPPGGSGLIEVEYNSKKRPGFFRKIIILSTEGQSKPSILYLKGEAK